MKAQKFLPGIKIPKSPDYSTPEAVTARARAYVSSWARGVYILLKQDGKVYREFRDALKKSALVLVSAWLVVGCASAPRNAECDAQARVEVQRARAVYDQSKGAQSLAVVEGFANWVSIFEDRPQYRTFYRACVKERGL